MIAVDTNILVYAHRADSPYHEAATRALSALGTARWAIPWPCVHEFYAIVTHPKTKARMVNAEACTGCKICQRACPWEMMSFDDVADKATKCFLCDGNPECVQVCSTGALRYVPWRDMSRAVPIRQATLPVTKDYKTAGCSSCHDITQ